MVLPLSAVCSASGNFDARCSSGPALRNVLVNDRGLLVRGFEKNCKFARVKKGV